MPRGKKTCTCGHIVGPATKICPECKTPFKKKGVKKLPKPKSERQKKTKKRKQKAKPWSREQVIAIPSGKPPIILKEFTEDKVKTWIVDCLRAGKNKGHLYTDQALLYWLRSYSFFNEGRNPYRSRHYKSAKKVIENFFKGHLKKEEDERN